MIIYKFDLCTRKWVCTRTSIYVQTKMDVHRRVGTYTIRVAHWFKSSFTGNDAAFNINGIQFECTDETETNDRSFICEKVFSKRVSVLCTDKSFVWKVFRYKENVYVHKECWFEYTQVKWKQTIEVYLYLSIKSICVMYR